MRGQIEKALEIKRYREKKWLAIPGVTAIGIGVVGDNHMGIIVSVEENADEISKKFPNYIKGIMIEVRETGKLKATEGS
ncbi:hypothetical protein OOZ15_05060 [Galbibacter sp. EGI 63066]|uniref:hypothetical protein n=1 Tax=Galbibacter sp. EGI 63066 TaxID=2993559 RepID=UPI002248D473|nr:hypothetical protein [Galbibacter sp. EGI 63066]MCX2679305.1 hypothetical protein [Galbibacter sp. EGI 63066]